MGAACSSCACCKPESQLGPKRLTDRGCTDVLCLLMFIIVVGSIFGIGIYAFDFVFCECSSEAAA